MSHEILIIEDEAIVAKNMRRYLERGGYQVHVAASGEDGIDQFGRLLPDVVLLDYRLPGIDGLEVLKRLRGEFGDVAIIVITGHGNDEVEVAAIKAGAAGYVSKPFVLSELKQAIECALRHR